MVQVCGKYGLAVKIRILVKLLFVMTCTCIYVGHLAKFEVQQIGENSEWEPLSLFFLKFPTIWRKLP